MKNRGIISLFVLAIIFAFSFIDKGENTNTNSSTIVLQATQDFVLNPFDLFVPTYIDRERGALAIDASKYKDRFAKASYTYIGEKSKFSLRFTSLTEIDGESTYRIFLENKLISEFQNPETTVDYVPYVHTIDNVMLKKGQKIQIEFNSHTNKKIPEKDAFAYSRGRWTTLQLIPFTKK